jgi:hypothetical protein
MLAAAGFMLPASRSLAGTEVDSISVSVGSAALLHESEARRYPGEPIPISGTETSTARLGPQRPRDTIGIQLWSVMASLYGIPMVAPHADGGVGVIRDASTIFESNDCSGGGIDVAIARPVGLYLEGGRLTLHEPLDLLEFGDTNGQYWITSAGLEIRF